jgi:hypothetical protein
LIHRYTLALVLLAALVLGAEPALAADGSFPPMNWRREGHWDALWSTRWSEGLFHSSRLSLRATRGGVQEAVTVETRLGLLIATRMLEDIPILPPRYYTPEEYARESMAISFNRVWREMTLQGLKGDPNLDVRRRAEGGLVNLDLPFELPGFAASIFGEGAPNLRVTGSERISIGGTSSWRSPEIRSEGRRRSLFPTLEMRQELNVRLNGTIGDKLHIDISQNSEASTSLENQIKIYYQGYDDDVIQRVDLGNTNLTLPRSTYVSVSTRQEGLFGVKMTGRLADWDFAVIASKQEGQSDVASYTGGTQESKIGGSDGRIDDIDFEKRKYFFLTDPDSLVGFRVDAPDLAVYVSTRNPDADRRNGRDVTDAYLSIEGDGSAPRIRDTVYRLTPNDDYYFVSSERTVYPVIILRNSLAQDYRMGVSFRYRGTGGNLLGDVGNFFIRGESDTLQLKMIKPAWDDIGTDELQASPWKTTRRLEAKNTYNLGVRGIDPTTLNLFVTNGALTNLPTTIASDFGEVSYLEVLGLDLINNVTGAAIGAGGVADNQQGPDGRVDPQYIDLDNGVLFLPDLRPFDPSSIDLNGGPVVGGQRLASRREFRRKALGYSTVVEGGNIVGYDRLPPVDAAKEVNTELYDKRDIKDYYRQYYFTGTFRAFQTEINLNRPGILENSETVRMDGEVLVRGIDYNITYETGQIRLLSSKATNPNGSLQITYAYTPLFSQGNRSLIGFSTTYGGSQTWDLSTTMLYESKGSTELRPRLQQEPSKTMLADLSGSWRTRPWILTRITDALPLVSTTAPSNLTFTGAVGVSIPNPNTKGSVYIDDMEGSIQTTSAGIGRESWQYSSTPVPPTGELSLRDAERLGALWFSVQRQVQRRDLAPDLQTIEGNDFISALGVILTPNPEVPPEGRPWLGLTSVLSQTGVDISEAQYLEMWVNDFNRFHGENAAAGEGKKIRIHLGRVSEDAVWDPQTPPRLDTEGRYLGQGQLDREDRNGDGQRSFDEDVGLDGLTSAEELAQGVPPDTTAYSPSRPSDPGGDDYEFTADPDDYSGSIADRVRRFRHLNGTENNQRLDTEDLNGNASLDLSNDYFELTFPLAVDSFTVIDVKKDYNLPVSSNNGWRLLRIPLNHPTVKSVGTPDLNSVRHLRLWFDGFSDTTEFQIASIEIIGNRWERQPILAANRQPLPDTTQFQQDKIFNVATVDNKQNADIYVPPFEPRTVDRVTELERSLNLQIENIDPGEEVSAFRPLLRDEDYTLYRVLQFYVQYRDTPVSSPFDSLEFFIRFSSTANADTVNSYEVSRVLDRPGQWQSFDLPIEQLSDLKIGIPDSVLVIGDRVSVEADIGGGWHARLYGRPSFSQLRRLQVGLRNVGSQRIVRREVWFNELRLGQVRRDTGLAGRGAVSMAFGDFANVSAAMDRRNADFLTLGQTRGTGVSTQSLTFTTSANLDKLAPMLSLSLPVSFDYRKNRNIPKFRANNDIIFDGDDSGLDITENSGSSVNMSLRRLSNQYTPWYLRNTLDALSLRFAYSKSFNRQTTSLDSTRTATGGLAYALRLGNVPGLPLPGRWKLTAIPETITLGYNASYSENVNYSRDLVDPSRLKKVRDTSTRSSGLQMQSSWRPLPPVTYAISSNRDLVKDNYRRFTINGVDYRPSLKLGGLDLGREVSRSERVTVSQSFALLSFFRPRVSWSGEYSENHGAEITTTADVSDFANSDSTRSIVPDLKNIENRNSLQMSWTVPVARLFQKLAQTGKTGPGGRTLADQRSNPPAAGTAQQPPPPKEPAPSAPAGAGDTLAVADSLAVGTAPGAAGEADSAAVAEAEPIDPKELAKREEEARKQAEREAKKKLEEEKKAAEEAKKAERRRIEEEKKAAEEAKKAEERRLKDEEKQRKEAERRQREARRGGIGGRRGGDEGAIAGADSAGTGAAPVAAASPGEDAAVDSTGAATPGGETPGTATPRPSAIDSRRAAEEAEKRAEEERKRRQAEAEAARKAAQPPPTLRQTLFRDLISVGDIRTNFSVSERNSVTRIHGTPDVPFRLGLTDDFGAVDRAVNSTESHTNTQTAGANATVTLLRDIALDANFQWNAQESENNRAISKTRGTVWPAFRTNLGSLEKKLGLGGIFNSFNASSNFERREEVSGTGNNARERVSVTSAWRPLLQFDAGWRNGWRTTFSADRSTSVSESNTGGLASSGVITTRTSTGYRLGLTKSLAMGGGASATRGGRNTVDLNIDLTYNKDSTLNDYRQSEEDPETRTDNLQGRVTASYRFTSTVSGSMQLSYGQRRDLEARTADRSIGLQATAAISF